jgi:uncharacterized protein YecE (DUF72 family)
MTAHKNSSTVARAGKRQGQLYVGTSGWSYGWEGFYPAGLRSKDYLAFYSRQFRTVEINYSFYHLPRPSTYEKWAAQTPPGFLFSVKLSKFITHIKKLSGIRDELGVFLVNASALGAKLGPILVQLPPSLKCDLDRLNEFLAAAKAAKEAGTQQPLRLALEFRHPSWFEPPEMDNLLQVLESHRAAFVLAHSKRFPYPESEPVTSDFVYLRFHGPEEMFASLYGRERLKRWAPTMKKWLAQGLDVYAYFNNDLSGYAVADARETLRLVG